MKSVSKVSNLNLQACYMYTCRANEKRSQMWTKRYDEKGFYKWNSKHRSVHISKGMPVLDGMPSKTGKQVLRGRLVSTL